MKEVYTLVREVLMENNVRFPDGCEVVGKRVVSEGVVHEEDFYIKGHHQEDLRAYGPTEVIDGETGVETRVRVTQAPSEYFHG